jgi:hypothetical protein
MTLSVLLGRIKTKQTQDATQQRARSFQLRFLEAALDAHSGMKLVDFGAISASGSLASDSILTRRVDGECVDIVRTQTQALLMGTYSARMILSPSRPPMWCEQVEGKPENQLHITS